MLDRFIKFNRCPRCFQGEVYHGFFKMRRACQECTLSFYPEIGFYTGAMIVSYLICAGAAMLTLVLLIFVVKLEMPWPIILPALGVLLQLPLVLPMARLTWLHLEYQITKRVH